MTPPARLTAFVSLMFLVPAVPSEGCSCAVERPATEALRHARAVFEGTVTDQRAVLVSFCEFAAPGIAYEFSVTRVWKGSVGSRVLLLRKGLCDPAFRVGQTYLVYASSDEGGRLLAAACTRTTPTDAAAVDLAELGSPLAVFERPRIEVLASMPLRRRIRASIVAGVVVYASVFREWRDARTSIEAAWLAVVVLQLCTAAVCTRRRRRRALVLVGAATVTALCAIVWSGERLLANEWYSPLVMWQ